ncbi:acetamidase/formamidase family protein [Caenimonas aquaedulcis]|uniref:Acetamidase/formamidase family protein n=1 Tax=Caenimonas aquaedulcis TaxID=2793270 RepID=A0A931MIY0_9BURK|nr:acetamidase/formamidase family protein [Caenimonas aquaedulcis]MBG9390497.1 acetamidase/formamidase family protein [Caenimonas aquaedulcis]
MKDNHTLRAAQLLSCGCESRLCHHRIAGGGAVAPLDGVEPDAIGRIADARGTALPRSRRSVLGAALGAIGAGSLVPLAGCAGGPAAGAPMAGPREGRTHVLPSTKETVRVGAMDPAARPGVTVDSGDVVHYPDTWVNWADEAKYGMAFDEREPIRKRYPAGPYSLVGPVEVRGAQPGDWIECRMVRLRPIEWGWNSAPLGVGALPSEFRKPYLQYFRFDAARTTAAFKEGVSYPLAPTQGVIATMPAGDKPVSGILSGPHGGNLVLRELTEGASIFLPVLRAGGMVWTGDSHAAQGDGVVNQTAIESAMEDMRIQFILHKRSPLRTLLAETPTQWISIGHGETLERALAASLVNSMDWLSAASGLGRDDVYSLISVAGSVRITQYSHQTNTVYTNVPAKGVHTVIPKSIFTATKIDQIAKATRTGA